MMTTAVNSIAVLLVTVISRTSERSRKFHYNNAILYMGNEPLGRTNVFDAKDEAVAADDLDAASSRKGSVRACQPDFAINPHSPFAALPGNGLPLRANQSLATGHYRPL